MAALTAAIDAKADMEKRAASAVHWLWITAAAVIFVVVWGAVVRLTSSGLSIPDWPLINGTLLPPFTDAGWSAVQEDYRLEAHRIGDDEFPPNLPVAEFRQAFWIEYLHRSLAAIVGIFFLFAFIQAMRTPAVKAKAEMSLYLLGTLLLSQAGLGGVVVKGALHAALVATHLVVAYVFWSLLIWTALSLARDGSVPAGGSRSAGYTPNRLAWATAAAALLQVAFGGLTAGTGGAEVANTFPMMGGSFFPPAEYLANASANGAGDNLLLNPVFVQFIHRWLPAALLGLFIALRVTTLRMPLGARALVAFRSISALLGLQIIVGVFNLIYAAPVVLSALHSAIALLIFGGLIVLMHDLRFESGEKVLATLKA